MNIAIITGASSGMGWEFARRLDSLLHKTDEIWLLARRKDKLDTLAAQMKIRTRAIVIDLTNEKELAQFAEVLSISSAGITVLVNCAGVGKYGAFTELESGEITKMLRLNILALTEMTRICLPYMRKGSRIIELSSGAAFLPQADFAVYAASKAYVYSFGRALAKELRERGIRVTTVCPGPVDTPFLKNAYDSPVHMGILKKLVMETTRRVVETALRDSRKGNPVSVCGLPMKLLYLTTQSIQNMMQFFMPNNERTCENCCPFRRLNKRVAKELS